MNQYVSPGYGMDTDGDALNFQLPISAEAVEDAKRLMLPSQNLLSPLNREPMFTPQEDYVQGLYEATRPRKKKGRTQVFATVNDMKAAYLRGDISLSDDVEILKR